MPLVRERLGAILNILRMWVQEWLNTVYSLVFYANFCFFNLCLWTKLKVEPYKIFTYYDLLILWCWTLYRSSTIVFLINSIMKNYHWQAWDLWEEGQAIQLMDQTLIDSYVHDEVMRCIHIGILCVEEDADDRPTMSNIISMLINRSARLSLPKRPAFYTRRKMLEAKTTYKESYAYSINEITISELDQR